MKSEALLMSMRPNMDNIFNFTFQNHSINKVNEHNHLGLTWNSDVSGKSHISSIISKASKRIDMLRALKFKLDRSSLEKIYFTFIRPIFEYACFVWDCAPRHCYYFNKMAKLQISAARIITGTNNYSSKHLLYHDTGWELLSSRREKQRLILFYKILNGIAPSHLCNLFETYLVNNQRYDLRSTNVQNVLARTETYHCSFFPSSIRSWNSLDQTVKDASTINEFKRKLILKKQKNKYYDLGSRCVNSILASMRMKCSQLNSHLFRNNIIQNRLFTCGIEETVFHYFFECCNFLNHRDSILMETLSITTLTVEKVFHGDKDININDNIKLHNAVSKYIIATKRFNIF